MPIETASYSAMTMAAAGLPGAQHAIDALVADFFSAFDNRNDNKPTLTFLLGLFTESAVIARSSPGAMEILSPMDFAKPRIDLLANGTLVDFHEVETSSTTAVFGRVAVRTSRYRKEGSWEGAPYAGAGTKCFQLVALDTGWRILSLAWIDDES
jgi:hypothetical protein